MIKITLYRGFRPSPYTTIGIVTLPAVPALNDRIVFKGEVHIAKQAIWHENGEVDLEVWTQ